MSMNYNGKLTSQLNSITIIKSLPVLGRVKKFESCGQRVSFWVNYANQVHEHCLNNKVFWYHMYPMIHICCLNIEIMLKISYIFLFFNLHRYFFLMKVIKKMSLGFGISCCCDRTLSRIFYEHSLSMWILRSLCWEKAECCGPIIVWILRLSISNSFQLKGIGQGLPEL